jgi:hypothetical protein
MKRHRSIILIVGSLVALAAGTAAAASASSLLSGYGGPGQGNQAILGSALLNGPGGGSGSSGAGPRSGTGSSAPGATAASPSGSGGTSGAAHGQGSNHGGAAAAPAGSQGQRSASRSSAAQSIAQVYDAAERGAPAPSAGMLGLSGSESLLLVLVLVVLVLIGALSRWLTRAPPGPRARRRRLKGCDASTD